MSKPQKETGGKAMDDLMSKLVRVPKAEIDKAEKRRKKNQKPKK